MSKTPVTVLGLGAMGTALAGAFVAGGLPTTVWNRTPAKAEPLVALGASAAGTLASAVTASELVVACLLDHDSVHQALDPVAAELSGRTLVNLTNGTPASSRTSPCRRRPSPTSWRPPSPRASAPNSWPPWGRCCRAGWRTATATRT